jgi:hypothetical protein
MGVDGAHALRHDQLRRCLMIAFDGTVDVLLSCD